MMTSVPVSFGDMEFCPRCTSMKFELVRQIEAFETLLNWNNNLKADILIQNLREVLKKFRTDNQVPSNTPTNAITTLSLLPSTNRQLQLENIALNGHSSNEISTTTTIGVQSKSRSTTCSSQESNKLDTSSFNFQKKGNTVLLTEGALNLEEENHNDDDEETSETQPSTAAKSKRKGKKRKKDQEVTVSSLNVDGEENDGEVNNLNQQIKTKKRVKQSPQPRKQVQRKQQEVVVKKKRRKRKLLFSLQSQRARSRKNYARQVKSAGQQKTTKVINDDANKDNNINNDGNDDEVETNANDDDDDDDNNNNNNHDEITKMDTEEKTEMNEFPPASQDHVLSYEKLQQAYSEIRHKKILFKTGRMRTVYECLICHKTLTVKVNAALHIRRVHYKDRVCCLDCHQTFYDWRQLREHRDQCSAKIGSLRSTANLMSLGNNNIQNDNNNDEEKIDININNSNIERDGMKKKATIKRKIQKRRLPTRKNPIKKKKLIKKWKSTITNNDTNENDDEDSNVSTPIGERATSPMDLPRKMTVKNAFPCFDLKRTLNVRVTMERLNLNNLKTEQVQGQQHQVANSNFNGEAFPQSFETNDYTNNEDCNEVDGDSQLNSINLFSRTREYSPDIINRPTTFKLPRRSRKSKKNRTRKEMENGTQTDFQSNYSAMISPFTPSPSSSSKNNNQIELSPLTTTTTISNQITEHGALSSCLPQLQFMGNQTNVRATTTTDQEQQDNLTPPSLKPIPRNFKNTGTNTNDDESSQQEDENELLMKQELTEERLIRQQLIYSDSPGSLVTHTNEDDTFSDLIDNERIESFSHLAENQEGTNTNICDENLNFNDSGEQEEESEQYDEIHENFEWEEEQETENLAVDTVALAETTNSKKKEKASAEEVNGLIRNTSAGLECSICDKVFALGKKAGVIQHLRVVHLRERDSECRFCGKIYSTQSLTLKHQRQCAELLFDATE